MGFTVSEKFTCPRCTDAFNITTSGKFQFLQNLRFNVCTTMTLLSMGAGWFNNQSPIYAYLQKAALTLRLILEALPIPSRRHRLRVWVMYLSIKCYSGIAQAGSPFFSSKFWLLWFWTYFQDHNPRLKIHPKLSPGLYQSFLCQHHHPSLSSLLSWPPSLPPPPSLPFILNLIIIISSWN